MIHDENEIINHYSKLGGRISTLNGKWYAKHQDKEKNWRKVQVTDKEKLIRKLGDIVNDHITGKNILSRDESYLTTVQALFKYKSYLLAQEKIGDLHLKPTSMNRKIQDIDNLINYLNQHNPDLAVKYVHLWEWSDANKLVNVIDMGSKHNSGWVRTRMFGVMKGCFDLCLLEGNIKNTQNILEHFKKANLMKKFTRTTKRKQYIQELFKTWNVSFMGDFQRYIKAQNNTSEPVRITAKLLATTGLRISELLALRKQDVKIRHNEGSYIEVVGSINGNSKRWENGTKTKAGYLRQIAIGRGLANELQEYIDKFLANSYFNGSYVYGYDDITQADVTGSDLLIPHIKNNLLQPFSYATISRKFEVLMKNQFSLRKGLVFHFFRHWCCTMWARHNIYDVYTACSMMGHEDLTTTQGIYTSVSKQMNKEDIEKDLYIDNYYF